MEKLRVEDVLPLDEYRRRRDEIRLRVRRLRNDRRVQVGDRLSLSFENRETVLFQIQEMIRVEEIIDPVKVAAEVAVYNDLVPEDGELRATFFVEITDRARLRQDLDTLVGLEREGLDLVVNGAHHPADFEPGHAREDRISAVQVVRFVLDEGALQAIRRDDVDLRVVVDHPAYRAEAFIGERTRQALLHDLGSSTHG